jgi:hypothetical protein
MSKMNIKDRYRGFRKVSSGAWIIYFMYRDELYSVVTNNSMAIDRLGYDEWDDMKKIYGYTYNQALYSLYNECKRFNQLGEYKN